MSQLRFNKSTLARVLGTFALAVLALGPGWRVVAQAPALLFGVNSGVAKPIAVDSSGNLKITVASGSPSFTSFGVGGTSLTGANVGVTAVKQITGIADTTATTVLTASMPNVSGNALVKVTYIGSLGAGGAIGAFESSCSGEILWNITRVAGVNMVSGAASQAEATTAVGVAGGATCTIARSFGAVSGGVTAVNTQTMQLTITRSAGTSANHVATIIYEILNSNAGANQITLS